VTVAAAVCQPSTGVPETSAVVTGALVSLAAVLTRK
jgi:hypothetical protein